MDNIKGIPYSMVEGDFDVDGFDVDGEGNYYFTNGFLHSSVIIKFNGAKNIFRKTYKGLIGTQLYIFDNKIYTLNSINKELNIFGMDGQLTKKIPLFTSDLINSFRFVDSTLIIDIVNNQSHWNYDLYTLSGKRVEKVNNLFNLSSAVFKNEQATPGVIFIGRWNNGYIFCRLDDNLSEKFWIVNNNGEVLKTKRVVIKQIGMPFEYIRGIVKNGSIILLGHNGKDGIITELSPAEMFK